MTKDKFLTTRDSTFGKALDTYGCGVLYILQILLRLWERGLPLGSLVDHHATGTDEFRSWPWRR